ncbi:hypothetical protein EDC04DRAFT_2901423 [Pisolithus marmoratus]|nr:hypothetical protein EDC04DRAFT_2901423 [Pisolithus marmoratus]
MKEATAAKRPVPPTPKPPPTALSAPSWAPPPPENLLKSELSKLCQEISKLRDRFTNYITSHEACCGCHSNSPSDSSDEEVTTGITPPPQAPPPVLLNLLPDGLSKPTANPLSWLVTAVNQQGLPYTFRDSIIVPSPLTPSTSFPEGTLEVVKLKFGDAPPLYIATHRDGELRVSTKALADMVTTTLNLPHDPYVPTLPHRRK